MDSPNSILAAQILLECRRIGVTEWVVCSGARNTPLLAALAANPELKIWHHFDERSAAFFALGRILATGRPVAIGTTSGTAAAELLPAMIEAHYQRKPLIAVTADRPASYRGTGAPQAIEQQNLFGNYVSGCKDIAERADAEIFANWDQISPWHLNVCFEEPNISEPGKQLSFNGLQEVMPARVRIDVAPLAQFLRNEAWKGTVVMLGGLEPTEREPVFHFLKSLGCPVIADATSGLRESLGTLSLCAGDRLMKAIAPASILRIGDIPIGRFWRDLEDLPEISVISVTRTEFSGLARPSEVVSGPIDRIFAGLGEIDRVGDQLNLVSASGRLRGIIEELCASLPESEPALIRSVSNYACLSDCVYLGNSMPIRQWNLAAQWQVEIFDIYANRGANGIDGQIATFLGLAASAKQAWAVLGDLTTLYDANAVAMATQLTCGKQVLAVVNNRGGRIFEQLPGGIKLPQAIEKTLVQPHNWAIKPLAELWHCHYREIRTVEDLDDEFADGLSLLEIVPDPKQTQDFWAAWENVKI